MAGLKGFTHSCEENLIDKNLFRCSLRDSSFSNEESTLIWDFYVARSFAAATGDPITLESYGWNDTNSKTNGYPALESALAQNSGISAFGIIRGKTIKDTLAAMGLNHDSICITHPRAVLTQNFYYESDENEVARVKSNESRVNAIFRHIRNSFAHGNTYFFDNEMCLLEDKDGCKLSAEILIPRRSLVDWIYIVDKDGVHYTRSSK